VTVDLASHYQLTIKKGELMYTVPEVVPISELRNKHRAVFALLGKGPIILAQRSRAVAVLVSIQEWDQRAKRLQELEWREKARQATTEARASTEPDLSFETFMAELSAYHEQR
jgi:prevent-host-death family protein